jgi:thiol-disulfide isomerase/thioredoxin
MQRRLALAAIGLPTVTAVTGLAAGLVPMPAAAITNLALGKPAPAFTATGADGKPVSLAALRGKTVVLEWTNDGCPYVRKHYVASRNIPNLQKEATAAGVVWLQVISSAPGTQGHVDGPGALRLNQERQAAPSAVVLDPAGQVGRAFGATVTPHIFIVDAQGRLVYKGAIDSIPSARADDIARAEPYVKMALADIAAGRPVATASTRPYGCTVKYVD